MRWGLDSGADSVHDLKSGILEKWWSCCICRNSGTIQCSPFSFSILKEREDCIISFRKSSFLGPSEFISLRLTLCDHCRLFPPHLIVSFINSKNCSSFVVCLLLCAANSFSYQLCWVWWSFRFLAALFCNYSTRCIRTSTSRILTTMMWAGFRQDCARLLRKASFMVLVWLIGPRHSIRF
jgi:hypothetical protein